MFFCLWVRTTETSSVSIIFSFSKAVTNGIPTTRGHAPMPSLPHLLHAFKLDCYFKCILKKGKIYSRRSRKDMHSMCNRKYCFKNTCLHILSNMHQRSQRFNQKKGSKTEWVVKNHRQTLKGMRLYTQPTAQFLAPSGGINTCSPIIRKTQINQDVNEMHPSPGFYVSVY